MKPTFPEGLAREWARGGGLSQGGTCGGWGEECIEKGDNEGMTEPSQDADLA